MSACSLSGPARKFLRFAADFSFAVRHASSAKTMHRIAVLLCLASAGTVGLCGPITYQFVDYPEYQSGYALSGSVTTDGTLGPISDANILSWQYAITGSSISRSVNSSFPSTYAAGNWFATASEFKLSAPAAGTGTLGQFIGGNASTNYGSTLFWQLWAIDVPAGSMYYARTQDYVASETVFWNQDPFTMDSRVSGWTIAVAPVPEPSTYAMALAGLACGGFSMWRRRRAA